MQFWPRSRSKHSFVRVRSWADEKQAKALGFICYKVGMTHVMAVDNRAKSLTKDKEISLPVTIIECPEMNVVGFALYGKHMYGVRKIASVLAPNLPKHLSRNITIPKKKHSLDNLPEFEFARLLVASNPGKTTTGVKRARMLEVAIGGKKEDQLEFAKSMLGKEISVQDVFGEGNYVDIHGVTKGKGFAGTVKRYGVAIKQHKGEKVKRGIGNLGAWTPKRVDYRVPQTGRMGNHLRTEYNRRIVKMGDNPKDFAPTSGLHKYGVLKNSYLFVHGSVSGARKTPILLTKATRPNAKYVRDAPTIRYISQ